MKRNNEDELIVLPITLLSEELIIIEIGKFLTFTTLKILCNIFKCEDHEYIPKCYTLLFNMSKMEKEMIKTENKYFNGKFLQIMSQYWSENIIPIVWIDKIIEFHKIYKKIREYFESLGGESDIYGKNITGKLTKSVEYWKKYEYSDDRYECKRMIKLIKEWMKIIDDFEIRKVNKKFHVSKDLLWKFQFSTVSEYKIRNSFERELRSNEYHFIISNDGSIENMIRFRIHLDLLTFKVRVMIDHSFSNRFIKSLITLSNFYCIFKDISGTICFEFSHFGSDGPLKMLEYLIHVSTRGYLNDIPSEIKFACDYDEWDWYDSSLSRFLSEKFINLV